LILGKCWRNQKDKVDLLDLMLFDKIGDWGSLILIFEDFVSNLRSSRADLGLWGSLIEIEIAILKNTLLNNTRKLCQSIRFYWTINRCINCK